jgi:hypothetical protein
MAELVALLDADLRRLGDEGEDDDRDRPSPAAEKKEFSLQNSVI